MQTISEIKVPINPITRKTLDMFVERVKEHEKNNLSKIVLFGSVARGEANKDSDIDVLVVLKQRNLQITEEIVGIGVDVMTNMDFDDDAYLQPIDLSEEEVNGLSFYRLMENINKEGVVLYASQ